MQEDFYEIHQERYLQTSQKVHLELFKKRAVTAAKIGFSPYAFEAGPVSLQTPQMVTPALAFWPYGDWHETALGGLRLGGEPGSG